MPTILNPFAAGGYSLADMTRAINILPNLYTRLGQMGLFTFQGVTQRSVVIEQREGVLSLLPTAPLGSPATVGSREGRSMRSFAVPWIPHDDVILPQDIQGVPALGSGDSADPLVALMTRKLTLMRNKHAGTREYMEINALRGIVKDGAGTTLYNYFTEFGITQQSVDFVLGTTGTKVQQKVRDVIRDIETNLKGESMSSVHALVSPEFFDKLIGHSATETAYQFYSATGAQPLREDVRRNFPFAGILFEEYNASVTLSTGTSERLIPAGEGIAFPMGTIDTFTTYGAPANLIEAANTVGLPLYARQLPRERGDGIDLLTEASILPVNKRPALAVRLFSSN
jgi:major capsid protein E